MTIFLSTTNVTTYRQMPYVSPSPLPTTMATNAVIPNTPVAENMAERINVQAATWCHFYWKDTNKGGERFFRKLSERAFNGHLIHEISECTWDAKEQVVTSPRSLSEMSAVYEFESLDWLKNIVQTDRNLKRSMSIQRRRSISRMTFQSGPSTARTTTFIQERWGSTCAPSRRPHRRRYPRRSDRDYTRRSRGTYDPVYHRL